MDETAEEQMETTEVPLTSTSTEEIAKDIAELKESMLEEKVTVSSEELKVSTEEPVDEEPKHKRIKPDKVIIPKDFYYDHSELMSHPVVAEDSGLPLDVVKMTFSLGYNSRKRDNIGLLDQDTLCFVAGNYLQFLNVNDINNHRYVRSLSGDGIGCMTVHHSKNYIAAGEKNTGSAPVVAIYEYPSLKLYRVLKEGTERAYAYCQFNTAGDLLATVGSDPDYMLTVWEWENEQIVLRSKAFAQDVYRVLWSADLEGILTTAGTGHIRFWKMADTFTGLKLQGNIGKFGKTEISDGEGFVILPDGKVLSGTEFGNLLVWDGDLIKVQIGRKNKKPCHSGTISQIIMEEGELMTIGYDGKIRTWDFESVDTAEVSEEMAVFEMEPMNELDVSQDAKLMHIVKSTDPESSIWFAQDCNGKIWKLDLSFSHTSAPPQILANYHPGEIVDCDVSPLSYLAASIGSDGDIRVFDFGSRTLVAETKFSDGGSKIIWAPVEVDPKGKTIIAGFHDGVIRILYFTQAFEVDGSKKSKLSGDITLIQALKPHTKKVTTLCINDTGEILITGSEDQTVFFFSISSPEYFPIGFVKLDKPIQYIEWKQTANVPNSKGNVLVCLAEGEIVEVTCPDPSLVDSTETFELQEIHPINTFKFVSTKSRVRHEEELERKRKEEEERQKLLAAERAKRLERGLETEEEQQKQIEEEERRRYEEALKEEEWVAYIPDEPSPIMFGFVDKADKEKFWLSMGGYDSGYIYQCEFPSDDKKNRLKLPEVYNEPLKLAPVSASNDAPLTCMKWNKSGKRVLMGFKNGYIRLQNVEEPFNIHTMSSFWHFGIHDSDYGTVTSICISHDEKFILSVGNDGNYFIYELMDENLQQKQMDEYRARLPSGRVPIDKGQVEDIADPNAYSIEEHKQKSEYDKRVRLAQEKKAATLKRVQELQKQFKSLKDQNDTLPERIRLSVETFELVPELRADLNLLKTERLELLNKQMAFESEKHRIGLEKLSKRFRDPLESEWFEVYAIKSDHKVSILRGCNLSEKYQQVMEELNNIRKEMMRKDMSKEATSVDKGQTIGEDMDLLAKVDDPFAKFNLKGSRGMRVARQLKRLDESKRKRANRKAQWDLLFADKPTDDYEDPLDISAIEEATTNMGDFKLKSSDDYFVPQKDRPNAFKARTELANIENKIYQLRSAFNAKVKTLRECKIQIIEKIKTTNNQIDICNGITLDKKRVYLPEVKLHLNEYPEKKYEYTKESLMDFKKELDDRKKAALQGEDNKQQFVSIKPTAEPTKPVKFGKIYNPNPQAVVEESFGGSDTNELMSFSLSELQKERKEIEEINVIYKTDKMIADMHKEIRIFDTKLKLLRHEEFELHLGLKLATLRQLTVYEEYRLLKMYEKSESSLAQKTEDKTNEKMDLTAKIADIQLKIESKKKDIDKLVEKEKLNFDKFKESLGENNKFAEYLNKVYKKKIKRRKKGEGEGEGDEESESSDSEDDDLDEDEEGSDEDAIVYDLDMCPPGCSQELYDSTCQLREIRLDIEEELVEERKVFETLKRDLETLTKKLKITESGLVQAKKEMEAFQLEKQQKLNLLKTVVILKLHQIIFHDNGVLPTDYEKALVFEASNYSRLKTRIIRLKEEESQQLEYGKQAKLNYIKLLQSRKLFQKKISDTQLDVDEQMKNKFGKIDNLERMEQVMINPKIEELTFKMLELQEDMYHEQSEWEDKIREAQELCILETKSNTCILDNILHLFNENASYEERLDSKQKNLGTEFQISGGNSEEELTKLNQLVQIQAQELDALKEEIGMLSRKGGHILPPMNNQSNIRSQDSDFIQQNSSSALNADIIQDQLTSEEQEVI